MTVNLIPEQARHCVGIEVRRKSAKKRYSEIKIYLFCFEVIGIIALCLDIGQQRDFLSLFSLLMK